MRKILVFVLLTVSLLLARAVAAQDAAKAEAAAAGALSGRWIVNAIFLVRQFISDCCWSSAAKS